MPYAPVSWIASTSPCEFVAAHFDGTVRRHDARRLDARRAIAEWRLSVENSLAPTLLAVRCGDSGSLPLVCAAQRGAMDATSNAVVGWRDAVTTTTTTAAAAPLFAWPTQHGNVVALAMHCDRTLLCCTRDVVLAFDI